MSVQRYLVCSKTCQDLISPCSKSLRKLPVVFSKVYLFLNIRKMEKTSLSNFFEKLNTFGQSHSFKGSICKISA